jgi:hypothetical protein
MDSAITWYQNYGGGVTSLRLDADFIVTQQANFTDLGGTAPARILEYNCIHDSVQAGHKFPIYQYLSYPNPRQFQEFDILARDLIELMDRIIHNEVENLYKTMHKQVSIIILIEEKVKRSLEYPHRSSQEWEALHCDYGPKILFMIEEGRRWVSIRQAQAVEKSNADILKIYLKNLASDFPVQNLPAEAAIPEPHPNMPDCEAAVLLGDDDSAMDQDLSDDDSNFEPEETPADFDEIVEIFDSQCKGRGIAVTKQDKKALSQTLRSNPSVEDWERFRRVASLNTLSINFF